MLNVYFAVAASRVIVDSLTNQVTIVDLYEKLRATSFPVTVPRLTLLFYVSRDNSDPENQDLLLICELAHQVIFEVRVKLEFKGEDTTRIVLGVDGLSLPSSGTLKARLLQQSNELGVLDLPIEEVKQQTATTANLVENSATRH
jgi:hypothetical protein